MEGKINVKTVFFLLFGVFTDHKRILRWSLFTRDSFWPVAYCFHVELSSGRAIRFHFVNFSSTVSCSIYTRTQALTASEASVGGHRSDMKNSGPSVLCRSRKMKA